MDAVDAGAGARPGEAHERAGVDTSHLPPEADPARDIFPMPGPQVRFLASEADIVFYGGAAGGGKTWALLLECLRHVDNPQFAAVVFRRTTPQIVNPGGLWDESLKLFPAAGGVPRLTAPRTWRFPSGAYVQFSHLQYESDKLEWQGSQVPLFCWDEVTHFEESQFFYLLSRSRSMSGVRPYFRCTCNPAPGWVRTFLSPWLDRGFGAEIPEGERLPHQRPAESGEVRHFVRAGGEVAWVPADYRDADGDPPKSVTFIRSSIYDNPRLLAADPGYLTSLKSLPEIDRRRLLDGDWDVFAGAFFAEYSYATHTVTPPHGPLPRHWTWFGGLDWGYASPFAFVLCAMDERGDIDVVEEITARGLSNPEQAQRVVALLGRYGLDPGDVLIAADPSMWARKRTADRVGEADIEAFQAAGLWVVEANNNRRHGWSRVREYLHVPGRLRIYRGRCPHLIRTLPLMQFADAGDREDMDTTGDDHLCLTGDACIRTERGGIALRDVLPGDRVLTRSGYRSVVESTCTRRCAPVYTLTLSNGATLTGTADHPVWVQGKGFTELAKICYGDAVITVSEAYLWAGSESRRSSSTTDIAIPEPVRSRVAVADTSEPCFRKPAWSVVVPTNPAAPSLSFVETRVVSVAPAGFAPVYNLQVEGKAEYFANGVLTHNCDSLRYALQTRPERPPDAPGGDGGDAARRHWPSWLKAARGVRKL